MPDEIERIVDEVLARLGHGETRGVTAPVSERVTAASGVSLQSVLVLTEDLGRVTTVLGAASRRQRQAISVFVGGTPRRRSNVAGFGELFFADDARHVRTDFGSRFETFVLFGVSLPTIARLAQIVIAEPLESIAFEALSRAKTVLMEPIVNDPSFERLPSGMKEEFSRLAHRLTEFGARPEQVENIFELGSLEAPRGDVIPDPAYNQASERRTGPVILTVRDIQESVGPGSRLTVTGPYRLTDLAREYVEKNGITVETRSRHETG